MSDPTLQPELLSLRAKLVDSIAQDEKQLTALHDRIGKNKELLLAINGSLGVLTKEATGYGAIADTVRSALKSLQATRFTADEVETQIRTLYPQAVIDKESIRTTLWNLAKKTGEITCVQRGSNQAPAKYEKINGIIHTRRVTEADREHTLKLHPEPQRIA